MAAYICKMRGGIEYPLTRDERARLINKMKLSGKNFPIFTKDDGTMLLLLHVLSIEPQEADPIKELEEERNALQELREKKKLEEIEANKSDKDKEREKIMDEMMAKSNCAHNDQTIHYQVTSKGKRYFPVCDFCGQRFRNVKASQLEDADKNNAKPWAKD